MESSVHVTHLEWMNDRKVSIDGYGGGGLCRHVHAQGTAHGHHAAEGLAQYPGTDHPVQRGEGHCQQTHEHVRESQVGYEDVSRWLEALVLGHHGHHKGVPTGADEENGAVHGDEKQLQGRRVAQDVGVEFQGSREVAGGAGLHMAARRHCCRHVWK